MSSQNCTRNGCKDVFRSYLVTNAKYAGDIEIPVLEPIKLLPNRLISFSKALSSNDYDQWVHPFEDDYQIERLWNRPKVYLPILKRFRGVISPDFSMYRDMPLVMQQWNTYRGRALGHWWQSQGIAVLPNVRASDSRSFSFCTKGVPKESPICVGTHGCLKNKLDRLFFAESLRFIVHDLHPSVIIVYGTAPKDVFNICQNAHIEIIQFESDFSLSRKGVKS